MAKMENLYCLINFQFPQLNERLDSHFDYYQELAKYGNTLRVVNIANWRISATSYLSLVLGGIRNKF